ncbi:MAG: hypothetical protein ACI9MR_004502, partial [Myxococcota bacterium]
MTFKAPESWPWAVVTLVAGVTSLLLGVLSTDPFGPATVLGAAAVLGLGGPAAGVTGLVALAVALGTPPWALTQTSPLVAVVSVGALALAIRALDPALTWQVRHRPVGVALWLCLLAAAALLLPDATAWLSDPSGAPLVAQTIVNDASNGMQRGIEAAAIVPLSPPMAGLKGWLIGGALVSAFILLAVRLGGYSTRTIVDPNEAVVVYPGPRLGSLIALVIHTVLASARWLRDRSMRTGWVVVAVFGLALAVFGGAGLASLFGGPVDVDTVALAHRWSLEASGYANVVSVDVPAVNALALWSRPMVDPLRLLLGILLVLVALPGLRAQAPSAATKAQTPGPRPMALLALGLGIVA